MQIVSATILEFASLDEFFIKREPLKTPIPPPAMRK